MKLVSAAINGYNKDTDARIMDVVLLSDDVPAKLPTTGEGIEGLSPSDTFAPLSLLYIANTGAVYVANESGNFVAQ